METEINVPEYEEVPPIREDLVNISEPDPDSERKSGEVELSETRIRNFFRNLFTEDLIKWRDGYVRIIAEQEGPDKRVNKQGKLIVIPKTPWMLPVWKRALEIVNEVLIEKIEIKKPVGGTTGPFIN